MRPVFGLVLGLALVALGLALEGGNLAALAHPAMLVLVLGGAGGALVTAYPAATLARSVRLALGGAAAPRRELETAARVFATLGKTAVLAGLVGLALGLAHVAEHLDVALATLGRGLAVAMLPLIYGLAIALFVARPAQDSLLARAAAS